MQTTSCKYQRKNLPPSSCSPVSRTLCTVYVGLNCLALLTQIGETGSLLLTIVAIGLLETLTKPEVIEELEPYDVY
jgi:hypothetical protein